MATKTKKSYTTKTHTTKNGTRVIRKAANDNDVKHSVPEWKLQAAVVKRLNQILDEHKKSNPPFAFAGDMNGIFIPSARAKVKAKATGLTAGEPDLRFYFPNGELKSIEMKTSVGRLTDSQKVRHPILRGLGFEVVVVKAANENEAADKVEEVVKGWMDNARVKA